MTASKPAVASRIVDGSGTGLMNPLTKLSPVLDQVM
jgi:hypothetical protein